MIEQFCHVHVLVKCNILLYIFNLTIKIYNLNEFRVYRITRSLIQNKISCVPLLLPPCMCDMSAVYTACIYPEESNAIQKDVIYNAIPSTK